MTSLHNKSVKKKAKAVALATDAGVAPVPTNVRTGCICRNQGRPINGRIYTDPCCKVHYAELSISAVIAIPKVEVTEAELEEWRKRDQPKKRLSYPKMTVATR